MSGQLSCPEATRQPPVEPTTSARRLAVDVLAILVAFGVAGVACGLLWEKVWTPPAGVAYQGTWVLDGAGLANDFAGTGLYALIGALAGLVLGVVLALLFDRDELVSLAAILLGATLAAGLMWVVGTALGPPDPARLAKPAADLTPIVGDLRVHGTGAFLGFPLGALLGASTVFLLSTRRRRSS